MTGNDLMAMVKMMQKQLDDIGRNDWIAVLFHGKMELPSVTIWSGDCRSKTDFEGDTLVQRMHAAEDHILKLTGRDIMAHGSPYDRGDSDAYYGRPANPHKLVFDDFGPTRGRVVKLTDPKEIGEYDRGRSENPSGRKVWGD